MKQKFFTGLLCLVQLLDFSQCYAQESNDLGQIQESSVTVTSDDMFIAHGKLSGSEAQTMSSELDNPGEKIKVFPNPFGQYIFVETAFIAEGTIQCILYDASGTQMMNMRFSAEYGVAKRIISTSKLAPGTYFLHAMYNGGDVSSGTIFTIKKK